MDFTDEKKRRIAFHEAGHAWMMWREGLGVRSLSMRPHTVVPGDNRGETVPDLAMEEGRKELSEKFAKAALAGCAAEHFLMGGWDEDSLQANTHDTKRARVFAAMSGDDRKPEALDDYLQEVENSVMEDISRPKVWHTITTLAYALMKAGTLDGGEVLDILREE